MKQNSKGYYRKTFSATMNDGTTKQVVVYDKDPDKLVTKYNKLKAEYDAGIWVVNSNTTLRHWVDEWIEVYKKPKVTSSTLKEIKGIMERVYLATIGDARICDLRLLHFQKCLNTLDGKSASYIHRACIYAKAAMEKACDNDMILRNPCRGLEEPIAPDPEERRPLTKPELKYFRQVIQTHPKGKFYGFMLACGARTQEAKALPVFSVNLKKEEVEITQSVQANTKNKIKGPKSKAGKRIIPIPRWYLPMLTEAVNKAIEIGSPYVFPNTKNDIMSNRSIYSGWRSVMRQMDILAGAKLYRNKIIIHSLSQDLTPYNLRHTYATDLAENGVDIKTAQYLLGHSDIRVTANIYTHVTNNMINNARDAINRVS